MQYEEIALNKPLSILSWTRHFTPRCYLVSEKIDATAQIVQQTTYEDWLSFKISNKVKASFALKTKVEQQSDTYVPGCQQISTP
jgi:hypothetical protein